MATCKVLSGIPLAPVIWVGSHVVYTHTDPQMEQTIEARLYS